MEYLGIRDNSLRGKKIEKVIITSILTVQRTNTWETVEKYTKYSDDDRNWKGKPSVLNNS